MKLIDFNKKIEVLRDRIFKKEFVNLDLHYQLNNTQSLPSPKPEEKIIEKPIDGIK
jgi:hypothetical protein